MLNSVLVARRRSLPRSRLHTAGHTYTIGARPSEIDGYPRKRDFCPPELTRAAPLPEGIDRERSALTSVYVGAVRVTSGSLEGHHAGSHRRSAVWSVALSTHWKELIGSLIRARFLLTWFGLRCAFAWIDEFWVEFEIVVHNNSMQVT